MTLTQAVPATDIPPADTRPPSARTGGRHRGAAADVSTPVHPRLVPPAVLRPATAADVEAICVMHRRCSPKSRHRRYLVATSEVSPANVGRLLVETATIVAEAVDGQLVAMGNVALGDVEAEIALLVQDDWHRQGLGVCLAGLLAGQAVAAGARVLTATVIGTNVGIRRTLAAAGLAPAVVGFDAGTLELHCDLVRWAQLVPRPASDGASPATSRDGADPDRVPVIDPHRGGGTRPPPGAGDPGQRGRRGDRPADGAHRHAGGGQPRSPMTQTMTDTMTDTMTGTMTDTMTSAVGDTMTNTMTGTMTSTVEHPVTAPAGVITVGQLRKVLSGLADDTALHLGVLDHQRFNTLLGSMPITAVRVLPGTADATLILHLPTR